MRSILSLFLAASMIAPLTTSAFAQNFTTAAEVKPILQVTKPSWIAVRVYDGKDLLYFTNLLAWRCGIREITYSVNGADFVPFVAEPCYRDTAQPNSLRAEDLSAILVSFAPETVKTVDVNVTFDDDTTETAHYERAAILMP